MKKFVTYINSLAALLMAGAAMTACSSDDNIVSDAQQPVNPTGHYTMTVNATMGDNGTKGSNRALSLDGKTLKVKWAETDHVAVFPEAWSWTPLGTLTAAASETGTTTLTGDLTGSVAVNDNLHMLFPRAEWNYTGQKGILLSDENSIEKKYDYALADVTVAEIDNSHITTTANANLASQQAIVKFILKNNDGSAALAADKLTISAASNKLVKGMGNYSKSTTHTGYTYDNGSGGFDAPSGLVDGSTGSKWCAGGEHKSNGVWYCEFHTASAVQVDGYTLTTGNDNSTWTGRNPKDWVLKAKVNSGDAWTTIATVANESTMEDIDFKPYDFIVDNPGTYQYFRIEISSARDGGTMQLSELQLWAGSYGAAYGDLTVTPASAASELTVALRNENAGADTYNLTATVGASTYTFEKSGVTFENGKYYNITVKMQPKKVSSITLNKSSINLTIGSTQTLSVSSVSPDDAVDKSVTWSSSATGVATVNPSTGEVTAVAEGTATITATANDGSGKTATCSVTVYPAGTIVWDSSNVSNLNVSGTYASYTKEGITLSANADMIHADWYGSGDESMNGISFSTNQSGGFTFTGKQFTKIEMTLNGHVGWDMAAMESKLGTGWSYSGDYMTKIYKVTWTGNATTVDLLKDADHFNGEYVKSIAFFVSE